MPVLEVDAISAKTLPALDRIFETDKDKLTDIIMKTEGAPLRRLLLAAIARNEYLGYEDDPKLSNTAKLLETLIRDNLLGVPHPAAIARMNAVLDTVGPPVERVMLSAAITRFNVLK